MLEKLSESQSLYLKHLILIRDESISNIYENFQQHKSYVRMMDEIVSYMVTYPSQENIYDDDDDDEVNTSKSNNPSTNCRRTMKRIRMPRQPRTSPPLL